LEDKRIIGARSTYHLRNSDAEEVEVADTGELEEELFGHKIPYCIARSANAVGDVCLPAPSIDQGLVILISQRYLPAILGGGKLASLQDRLDDGLLVHRIGDMLNALDNGSFGSRNRSVDAALRISRKSAGLVRFGAFQTIGAAHAGHHDGAMCIKKKKNVITPENLLFFFPRKTISEREICAARISTLAIQASSLDSHSEKLSGSGTEHLRRQV
jgi:hypothetical protein